jgi:Cysteine dioxygenase type I
MAIAVSPPVGIPLPDEGAGPRRIAMPLPHQAPGLSRRLSRVTHPGPDDLLSIALGLAARAPSWPGMAQPTCRSWELMVASETVEAWVIAWPSGGSVELHDHGGSAGAVVVAQGELVETSVVLQPSGGVALRTNTIGVGGSISFGGHHVHDIVNGGAVPAISVHVYAPRLTSMTYYQLTEVGLEAGSTVRYRFGEAVA